MKKQNKKIVLFIIFILIISIFLLKIRKEFNNQFQEELIFFKYFSSKQKNSKDVIKSKSQESQDYPQYQFEVFFKNTDFKNINLSDTIKKETLINEKIAPGTRGIFEIILKSKEKIHYQIKFKSKNQKPKNLFFYIKGKDKKYQTLEEMEEELQGEIKERKNFIIYWEWKYETNEIQNIQDTKDGETIRQYNFTIYVTGQ